MLVFSVLTISYSFYFYQILFTPNLQVDQPDRYLYIKTGSTFRDVQRTLLDDKYVNNLMAFSLLAKIMDYDELVKPGRYLIKKNSTNLRVIKELRAGEQTPVQITFSNARMMNDMAESVCNNIELTPVELEKHLYDSTVYKKYGFDQETFRCMFIPNTYEVYWNISAPNLVDRFHREYEKFWSGDRRQKADEIGFTPVQVEILASIVEAETKHYDESPKIAGLYINRLKRGMLLQADPTVVYAMGDFTVQRVLNKDKEISSPYNTYKYVGLPPGPINFPSIKAIDAVLNYTKSDDLYMCAKEDFSGYHNFTSSLSQHMRNARKYQRALNKAKLYR